MNIRNKGCCLNDTDGIPFILRKEEIIMMNYEDFKKAVKETFKEYLPKPYNSMEVIIAPVKKVNGTLDGMSLKGNIKERNVSPRIYIQEMYEHYKERNDLQEVLEVWADRMVQAFEQLPKMEQIGLENAEENIIFQLINTEWNKEMLSDVPHRSFLDLSIIYRLVLKVDADGIQSTLVHNEMAEVLGLSEERLFTLAKENTKRILPHTVTPMQKMLSTEPAFAEFLDIDSEISPKEDMYYISNAMGFKGANSMLYKEIFHGLAQQLDDDLFILPSSTEEVLAVSASVHDPGWLVQLVPEINTQIVQGIVLSDKVYRYYRDTGEIGFAKDSPCIESEIVVTD